MIQITIKDAALKVLAAYEAGTLSAQAPQPQGSYYTEQRGQVFRCAIGQLLDPEFAKKLETSTGGYPLAGDLIEAGDIETDSPENMAIMQRMHDVWANTRTLDAEQRFVDFVKALAQ